MGIGMDLKKWNRNISDNMCIKMRDEVIMSLRRGNIA